MKRILLIICSLLVLFSITGSAQNYATITPDSAQSLILYHNLDPNFIILDVRTEGEYNTKHIENGVNLNYYLSTFDEILDTLIKDKIYLIHCASGSRSGNAFNSMQTKGFTDVFNLSGGVNAWESSGKSITTNISPILLPVSDTLVDLMSVDLGHSGVLDVTITNFGNDTLDFLSLTDLSGTAFSTNFNLDARLTGLMDYTFQVFYNPVVEQEDSLVFQIESDGGNIEFVIEGQGYELSVASLNQPNLSVFPNPTNGRLTIENTSVFSVELININGQIVFVGKETKSQQVFDFSNQKEGVYFLRIKSGNQILIKKLVLL